MSKIILAEHAGFCFGVSRAVGKAFELGGNNKKIYTFGELIHNKDVVNKLEESEITAIEESDFKNLKRDDTVLIRSHGVGKEALDQINEISGNVVNLTCPYVLNIQKRVSEYHKKGYTIVILGDKDHPEVVGINGWCENKALISKEGNVDFKVSGKVCVVAQTTEKQSNWIKLISNLAGLTKELCAFNTICTATELRQSSTEKLSKEVDAMVVIGGKHSSNTTKLYEICKKNCKNSYFVENAKELEKYREELSGFEKIGVTAGASTPDWIIKEAMELL
ncbi:MAG: 4-hydroxy-3-methylbut-2-enyl diphosphate reductase [Clostridiaceae bacterium]